MRVLPLVAVGLLPALLGALVACGGERADSLVPAPGFSAARITVEDGEVRERLEVEVAATVAARQQGLMFRRELPDGQGMLFLYPPGSRGGHWMRNTYLALDIAYADEAGTVFQVVQGKPLDETVLAASAPFTYVLEVPAGWFDEHGLGPGSRLVVPTNLPAGE